MTVMSGDSGQSSDINGMESAAVSILTRAVELDNQRRFTEATVCYQEGLQILMNVIKATSEPKRSKLREKALQYMDRAEQIKVQVEQEKEAGKYHEQIHIANESTGHSYAKVFGPFLDANITAVTVEDPYIRSIHQVYNFLRFCELLVMSCKRLRIITLKTSLQSGDVGRQQNEQLLEIRRSLGEFNVTLVIVDVPTLHDREIRLNNGWIIKIGRGLDYFKPSRSKFSIGHCEFDLRHCHQTTVDIIHDASLKT